MILDFHRTRAVRFTHPDLSHPPPAETTRPRKPNRLGLKRRRNFVAFIRRRGVATLAELSARYGQHVALCTLTTLWEMGRLDVLDGDRFRLKEATP